MLKHVCHRSANLACAFRRFFSSAGAPVWVAPTPGQAPAAAAAAAPTPPPPSTEVSDTEESLIAAIPSRAAKRQSALPPSSADAPSEGASSGAADAVGSGEDGAKGAGLYTLSQYHRDRRMIADQIQCVALLLLPAGCLLPRPLPLPHLPLSLLQNAPLASPAGACGTWTRAP